MNERLKQFLAAENISQSQFADRIKVVRASVSHVLAGRNKPGYDFIAAIMAAYPNLSIDWLMLGKGKMYKTMSDAQLSSEKSNESHVEAVISEMPQLFDYVQGDEHAEGVLPDENFAPYEHTVSPTVGSSIQSNRRNTTNNDIQLYGSQRKAVKIAVFYDDGTYQEFQNL